MKDYLNFKGDFRSLPKKDLEMLFVLLKDYKLKYRNTLGLDELVSFGVEIEFEDVLLYYIKKEFSKHPAFSHYFIHEDDSCSYKIDGFAVGGEVSTPILHDTKIDWQILREVLLTLKKLRAHTTDRTSIHVHVGAQIFREDIKNVCNFVKVWCIFEHVIFKFAYGSDHTYRSRILEFAHPIADATKLKCKYIPGFLENLIVPKELGYDKKWAINFNNYQFFSEKEEVNNTIEIRIANGTLKQNIIQNTIYFYLKLMNYVMSDDFDEELINHLFSRLIPKNLEAYDDIYIKDALLLTDLIFDNSLDKINFLKQYVKNDEFVFIK